MEDGAALDHNEANGEGGRDGVLVNESWNCGVEGQTEAREVLDALLTRRLRPETWS